MLRGIVTVGGWTMASRLLGFLRDILIADLLGAGAVADAFFVALKLPNLFRRLFGEGAFNAAFVPAFAGTLATEGPAKAQRLAAETASVMTVWLGALSLLGVLFMPEVMAVLAPGFARVPAKFALAVTLTRITFPYLMLICLTALLSGMLNARDKFAAAAAAPVLFNVFAIAALLLTPYFPTAGHALAWGVMASGIAQFALLAVAVARAGMALRLPPPRLTPAVRALLRRMAPGVLGAGVTQLNVAVDTIIGSLLAPGTVSLLYYADRVNQLPLGVIGAAVGTAVLPLLSRQVRGGEAAAARATLNRAIEFALVLTLPAALALAVAAQPIIAVLFGRGAFGAASVSQTAHILAAYAAGLPAFVLAKVLAPGFFARGDTTTPVKIGIGAVALNVVLNLALMRPLGAVGPALATTLAALFNAGMLGLKLARRGDLRPDARLAHRLPRVALAAFAMALALLAAGLAFPQNGAPHALRWAALALLVAGGLAVYGATGQAVRAFDLRELARVFARRRLATSGATGAG